jgi:FAD/FMN-containing dehydrogenase
MDRVDGQFVLFALGMALDAEMGAFMLDYARRVKAALAPWSTGGHYLNFAEEAVDTSLTHAGETWARLQAVKARVDPDNVIHANHAI